MRRLSPEKVAAREEEILAAAGRILTREGQAAVTMDRLAAEVPFSKGTLYNHYASREDILLALLCRQSEAFLTLLDKAAVTAARPRPRFFALAVAAEIGGRTEGCSMLAVGADVYGSASAPLRERFSRVHQAIVALFCGVVRDGIASGDLPAETRTETVAHGAWALFAGSDELRARRLICADLPDRAFGGIQRAMLAHLLDGFRWAPLSRDFDYEALRLKLLQTQFAEHCRRLRLDPWEL
ncbi:MAG: TetR/AcrR family transcriptional regulator [Puniceicoccaceae bacterium]|nr:MAG: TetR/AcrR family transcriptional regulator [Puniceicoccaceae bacterium]